MALQPLSVANYMMAIQPLAVQPSIIAHE